MELGYRNIVRREGKRLGSGHVQSTTSWAATTLRCLLGIEESPMNGERHDFQTDIEQTISNYVELQREVLEHMSGNESIAQGVYDAIDEAILAIRSPIDPRISSAVKLFRRLPEEYVEPALELFTARAFQVLLPDMARLERRIETLIVLSQDAAPSQRAATTLAKVVRCYLLGLDAETIAMCRAALDVSVGDAFDSLPASPKVVSMRQKLDRLRSAGRLSDAEQGDALAVWQHGNEVLHKNVDAVDEASELLSKTLRVTAALFPQSTA